MQTFAGAPVTSRDVKSVKSMKLLEILLDTELGITKLLAAWVAAPVTCKSKLTVC